MRWLIYLPNIRATKKRFFCYSFEGIENLHEIVRPEYRPVKCVYRYCVVKRRFAASEYRPLKYAYRYRMVKRRFAATSAGR